MKDKRWEKLTRFKGKGRARPLHHQSPRHQTQALPPVLGRGEEPEKRHKHRRTRRNDCLLESLSKQVSDLQNHLYYHNSPAERERDNRPIIDLDISRDLFSGDFESRTSTPAPFDFNINISTNVKEPAVPKTTPNTWRLRK